MISFAISQTVLLLVSIFTVSSREYRLILATLLPIISAVRIPRVISEANRFLKFISSAVREIFDGLDDEINYSADSLEDWA